jgi:hypothetical protein
MGPYGKRVDKKIFFFFSNEKVIRQAFLQERQKRIKIVVKLKFLVYYISLALLVGLTAIQSGQIVYKFLEEPTYISSQYLNQDSAAFPSMSICPDVDKEARFS